MQFKSSLKQLLVESRANPGFTSLYIGGVAFAVAFTMVFAIIYYVHLAPLYPEYGRSTTYYISNLTVRNDKTHSMNQSSAGIPFYREFVENSENIEYSTVVRPPERLHTAAGPERRHRSLHHRHRPRFFQSLLL